MTDDEYMRLADDGCPHCCEHVAGPEWGVGLRRPYLYLWFALQSLWRNYPQFSRPGWLG